MAWRLGQPGHGWRAEGRCDLALLLGNVDQPQEGSVAIDRRSEGGEQGNSTAMQAAIPQAVAAAIEDPTRPIAATRVAAWFRREAAGRDYAVGGVTLSGSLPRRLPQGQAGDAQLVRIDGEQPETKTVEARGAYGDREPARTVGTRPRPTGT